ncbi:UNVERIFIED_CONTAM: hypothetical protein HDU68_004711, partial [Siphonaria sp. JEL0065]
MSPTTSVKRSESSGKTGVKRSNSRTNCKTTTYFKKSSNASLGDIEIDSETGQQLPHKVENNNAKDVEPLADTRESTNELERNIIEKDELVSHIVSESILRKDSNPNDYFDPQLREIQNEENEQETVSLPEKAVTSHLSDSVEFSGGADIYRKSTHTQVEMRAEAPKRSDVLDELNRNTDDPTKYQPEIELQPIVNDFQQNQSTISRKTSVKSKLPITKKSIIVHKTNSIQSIKVEDPDIIHHAVQPPSMGGSVGSIANSQTTKDCSKLDAAQSAILKSSGISVLDDDEFTSCTSQIGLTTHELPNSGYIGSELFQKNLPILPSKSVESKVHNCDNVPYEYFYQNGSSQKLGDVFSPDAHSQEFSFASKEGPRPSNLLSPNTFNSSGVLRSMANLVAARSISSLEPQDVVEVITANLIDAIEPYLQDGEIVRKAVEDVIIVRLTKELSFLMEIQ